MKSDNGPGIKLALGAGGMVLLLWALNWVTSAFMEPAERGVFGDQFGAVNALFSGLAFAGVIYAISLQRHEVRMLHEELERSKEILEKQQELADVQIAAQRHQAFEATFFQLLGLFTKLVEEMAVNRSEGTSTSGKGRFVEFCRYFRICAGLEAKGIVEPKLKPFDEAVDKFYKEKSSELGHYFRTLYNLYKFVDESDVHDKRRYSNLIRAQLSNDEAMLLFVNGLTEHGAKFKPLIEKFAVLKNVDRKDIIFSWAKHQDVTAYDGRAFGE